MGEYNSGNKSATVIRFKIGTNTRYFHFPEITDINALRDYLFNIINNFEELKNHEFEISYIGNRMISNYERYNTQDDIEKYLEFILGNNKRNKR
jgi:hypothetical protein